MDKKQNGKLFVLSAPSGGGKTTITHKIIELMHPDYNLSRVITYTSRTPRSTDKPGIDYHFLSKTEFEEKIERQFFLEWSQDYGNYYGTPADLIINVEQGSSFIAVVDRLGVRSILSKYQHAVAIWLEPPSLQILEGRLRARKTELEEQIQKRLSLAKQELEEERLVNLYHYRLINDLFDQTVGELHHIIMQELKK